MNDTDDECATKLRFEFRKVEALSAALFGVGLVLFAFFVVAAKR